MKHAFFIIAVIAAIASNITAHAAGTNCTTRTVQNDLIIYTPHYSKVDLVCGKMPSKSDSRVIYCAEAAFTGQLLNTFKHENIAGNHVCSGKKYMGYSCRQNTGAFVYYNGKFKFLYKEYAAELDRAAKNGGMGFGQEMMIHNGKRVPTLREDSNRNEFRALCCLKGKLCVIDSKGSVKFGDFIKSLLKAGVTEALYLDMGGGWNYSWWRHSDGKAYEIHSVRTQYTTNWITFYK